MRILHAKTSNEQILLGSACPCMDLVAVISVTLVSVYRVGSHLTPIVTVRLRAEGGGGLRNGVASAIDWSPSGRLLSIGFQDGWLFSMDVETGNVVRLFFPTIAARCDGAVPLPPMLLRESEGGTATVSDSAIRAWSLSGAVLACRWQSGSPKSVPLDPTTCIPLPSLRTRAPMIAELHRSDTVPLLLAVDSALHLSISLGGMSEVHHVVLNAPSHAAAICRAWMMPPAAEPTAAAVGRKDGSPGAIPRASRSPVRSFCVTPPGADLLMLLRTAPNTDRLFSAALGPRQWHACVTHESVLVSLVLDEYITLGLSSLTACARKWASCVKEVYRVSLLGDALGSASATASLLRDVLIAPLASPCVNDIDQLLAKYQTVSLFQCLEQLHECMDVVVAQLQGETMRSLEAALDLSLRLASSPSSAIIDEKDVSERSCLREFVGSVLIAARAFVTFVQREGNHFDMLVCWILQLLRKRATHPEAATTPSSNGASGSNRWYNAPQTEDQPVIARTLYRVACGTATASGLACSLDELGEFSAKWSYRYRQRFLPALAIHKSSSEVVSAPLSDLSARQISQPLAPGATPRFSFMSLMFSQTGAPAARSLAVEDDDNLGPLLLRSDQGAHRKDDDAPGCCSARLFHVKDSSGAIPPQVTIYAVPTASVTRLESGPAPIAFDVIRRPSSTTTPPTPHHHGDDTPFALVGFSELGDNHLLMFARGAQGVTLAVVDPSGECCTFMADVGDADGQQEATHAILDINGLSATVPAHLQNQTTPDAAGSAVELSICSSRGFGVLYGIDRFMVLQFDC